MSSLCRLLILLLGYFLSGVLTADITEAKLVGESGATVQEAGTMTLEFNPSGNVFSNGDTITLVFPSGMSMNSTTPTCTEQFGEFNISSCAYTAATNTLVLNIQVTSDRVPAFGFINIENFIYPISSIRTQNPSNDVYYISSWPATGGMNFTLADSGGASKGSISNVKITGVDPGTITSLIINHDSSKPNVGETNATLFFSVTVPHIVPTDGTMTIFFPKQPVSDDDVVVSPTCRQSGGTMETGLTCSYSSTTQLVTITNFLSSNSSGTFNFTIGGIVNPISTEPVTGIEITTKTQDGGTIDSGTQSWSVPNAYTITGAQWSITSSDTKINSLSQHRIFFSLPFPVVLNSSALFTFPSDTPLSSDLTSYIGSNLFKSGVTFHARTETTAHINCSESNTPFNATNVVTFRQIRNPNKLKTTGSLQISLYTTSGAIIASVTSGITLDGGSLTSGAVTVSSVVATGTEVQQSDAQYRFVFNPESSLSYSGSDSPKIVMKFPAGVIVGSSCAFSDIAGSLSSALTCSVNSGANSLEINNPFGGSNYISSSTNLEITLRNLTNPDISGDAGTFTIETYITDGIDNYLVDTGTFSGVTITSGSLTSPSLTSNSTVAYDNTAVYTITFTSPHTIRANGIIDIIIPSEITLNSTTAISGCQGSINGAAFSSVTCQSPATNRIRVTTLFTSDVTGELSVRFPGLRNPRVTGTTSSLSVTISDSSGNLINSLSTGFTLTIDSVENFQNFNIQSTETNRINGAFNAYIVRITAQTPSIDGDKVILVFPESITFPASNSDLSCNAGTNVVTITCTMNSSSKTITATTISYTGGGVSEGTQFDFTINTLGNPGSLAPVAMISAKLIDTNDNNVSGYTTISSVTIQNNRAGALTGQRLQQSVTSAGQESTYTFTFTPTNPVPQNSKLELIYPSTYTIPSSITCMGLTGIPANTILDCTSDHNTASRNLKLLNGFNTTTNVTSEISFQIQGITNPISDTLTSFEISTYTQNDFAIDTVSDGFVPTLECNYPCKTCSSTNASACTSCFTQAETGSPLLQTGTCKASCDSGYSSNGGTTCVQCNGICLTCSQANRNVCETCNTTGTYKFFYNETDLCYATCPDGSYADSNNCRACTTPCSTCNSTTFCLSCVSTSATPYLQAGGTCTNQCSNIQTPVNNICTDCNSPCSSCGPSPSDCTSCIGTLLLYRTGCVSTCPDNTLQQGDQCFDCDSKCSSCVNTTTTCSSCANGLYLYEENCQVCPSGYKGNLQTGYCEPAPPTESDNPDYRLAYFPFLCIAIGLAIFASLGNLKDSNSQFLSVVISFWGLVEIFLYSALGLFAYRDHDNFSILGICGLIVSLNILLNLIFTCYLCCKLKRDDSFNYWKRSYPCTYFITILVSLVLSFKFLRMFYSKFFGFEHFSCSISDKRSLLYPITIISGINFIICMIPIVLISFIGLITTSWGTQFFITCIECLIFLLLTLLITIIEFNTAKLENYERIESVADSFVDVKAVPAPPPDDNDVELRRQALRKILNTLWVNEKDQQDDDIIKCLSKGKEWIHERYSLPDIFCYQESDSENRPYSYPVSPKTREGVVIEDWEFMRTRHEEDLQDNVYCDSKPKAEISDNRTSKSTFTQTFTKDNARNDNFSFNESFFDYDSLQLKNHKLRESASDGHDPEDYIDHDTYQISTVNRLGVIYEEEEPLNKMKSSLKRFDKVIFSKPPKFEKKFNEHSIMGEFDKDSEGNLIILTNSKGHLVCNNGRRVNERGYLVDKFGNILYCSNQKLRAFEAFDLDSKGEIPNPYLWDRFNFNPSDIMGNVDTGFSYQKPPKRYKASKKRKELMDKDGFRISKKGYLIDINGNIVSRADGEIKLDTSQMTPEGDIPHLYTYSGKSFHIKKCIGEFKRDEDGNAIILSEVDELGNITYEDIFQRKVNKRGYLIDEYGNIISNTGNILFQESEIKEDGEIPKIFPFTNFQISTIKGNLEENSTGRVRILEEDSNGGAIDNHDRRVNSKGYYTDEEGNILDRNGNIVIESYLVAENGEIPKIFRSGLLCKESESTMITFANMSKANHQKSSSVKIHQFHPKEIKPLKIYEEEKGEAGNAVDPNQFYKNSRKSSGDNSKMRDRPSNYNNANMETLEALIDDNTDDPVTSDNYEAGPPLFEDRKKVKTSFSFENQENNLLSVHLKSNVVRNKEKYKKPKGKDFMMADAYGGIPRGARINNNNYTSERNKSKKKLSSHNSKANVKTQNKANSTIGSEKDKLLAASSKHTIEVDTKLLIRKTDKLNSSLRNPSMREDAKSPNYAVNKSMEMEARNHLINNDSLCILEETKENDLKNAKKGKKRNKTKGRNKKAVDNFIIPSEDLEKVYNQDVDQFLQNDKWDVGSKRPMSSKPVLNSRIRDLEAIYLARMNNQSSQDIDMYKNTKLKSSIGSKIPSKLSKFTSRAQSKQALRYTENRSLSNI
ncbi:unnamed protein product [Moneuplotes crassus]|uniref:Uncharacterized protein n=1 Tax=Euplotes crassus TaxID=5936 RepID=A0AAD1XHA3_EUPCR|nr:unnamed protein product [Moneuplotes crassus]